MELNIEKAKVTKAQSILEYLIVMSAIIVVIIINTVGFSGGIQNSLNLQNSLNTTQEAIETGIIRDVTPPPQVTSESYYVPPSENVSNPNNTDSYGGPQYTGGYNYNNWVNNNPENGNINRTGNSTTGN